MPLIHGHDVLSDDGGESLRVAMHPEIPAEIAAAARGLPGFGLYHDKPWNDVLTQAFGWPVSAMTAHRRDQLVAYLPYVRKRRLGRLVHVCLPLSHDAGVLVKSGEEAVLEALFAGVMPLELHAAIPGRAIDELAEAEHVESVIDLARFDGSEALFGGMTNSRRRKIRQAGRAGVATRDATDAEGFRIFAELQSRTRQRQGAPDYPRRFFPAMAEHLGGQGTARLRLGFLDGRPVAGVILLIDRHLSRVIYGYGASIEDRDVLATGVNPLLLWEAMEQALADGFASFSFGSTAAHHRQLLTYKERFGATARPLARVRVPAGGVRQVREGGFLNRLAAPVLRAMPLGTFRTLSPILLAEVI
jgi:hypothetical protein